MLLKPKQKSSYEGNNQAALASAEKIPLRYRLATKMSLQTGLLLLIILSIMVAAIGYSVSQIISAHIDDKIILLAKQNATIAGEYLDTMQLRANALAETLSSLEGRNTENTEYNEVFIQDLMKDVLGDQRIFSVYTAWEPNMFFQDTPEGLSFYHYWDGNTIRTDVLNDYQTYKDGDYYAVARDTLKPHITEPYQYELTSGETIWLITISNPILSKSGEFLGVANCDIRMDTLNGLSYETGGYQNAYSYILSNQGVYLANSRIPDSMGTVFGAGLEEPGDLEMVEQVLSIVQGGEELKSVRNNISSGEKSYIIFEPLFIKGIEQPLSSSFVVSEAEAFASVKHTIYLIILLSLVALIILISAVGVFTKRALRPLNTILNMAEQMRNGNLNTEIEVKTRDEFGHLTAVFQETSAVLTAYISEISTLLETLASGDLRITVLNEYAGDFAPIKAALLQISSSLNQTLAYIDLAASQVNSGAEQVSMTAQSLATGAAAQAATVEELNSSISIVAEQVQENAENVRRAAGYVDETNTAVTAGNQNMVLLSHAMEEVKEASEKINGITKVIEDISFQTNILALNAAVEAARAGAAGKGFAVVADEVRNLAAKSAEAVKQTAELIGVSTAKVAEGIKVTEETVLNLNSVAEKTGRVNDLIHHIESASTEQSGAIRQITQGMEQVSAVVQNNAATAEESSASSEELSSQAHLLQQVVSKFTLKTKDHSVVAHVDIESAEGVSAGSFEKY